MNTFWETLYDLSERGLRAIDRYEVGKQLNLPKEEIDAIVNQLTDRGRITKITGSTKIMLGRKEKKILDSEWRQVEWNETNEIIGKEIETIL